MAGLDDAASQLESVARHLRQAGDGNLVREVTAAMRRAVVPVQAEIRAGLRPRLPNRYADTLDADLRLSVSVRTTGRDPRVSVTATTRSGKRRKLSRLDAGLLEHPLFGDRDRWYAQDEPTVQPGWFSGPAEAARPRVRAEIDQALADVAAKAARKGP